MLGNVGANLVCTERRFALVLLDQVRKNGLNFVVNFLFRDNIEFKNAKIG